MVPSSICNFSVSSKYSAFLLDWLHHSLFPFALFCSESMKSLVFTLQKDLCRIGNSIRFFPDVGKPYGYSYHNILQCKWNNVKLSTIFNTAWNIVTSTNEWIKHCKHSSLRKEIKIVCKGEKILAYIYLQIHAHSYLARYFIYTTHMYPYILKEGESGSIGSEAELLL